MFGLRAYALYVFGYLHVLQCWSHPPLPTHNPHIHIQYIHCERSIAWNIRPPRKMPPHQLSRHKICRCVYTSDEMAPLTILYVYMCEFTTENGCGYRAAGSWEYFTRCYFFAAMPDCALVPHHIIPTQLRRIFPSLNLLRIFGRTVGATFISRFFLFDIYYVYIIHKVDVMLLYNK